MISNFFRMAVKNITHRKLRSWLTMIGIFIGVTAVVAIISLGQGLQEAIHQQLVEIGGDKIWVMPGASSLGGETPVVLDEEDLRVIEGVPGVQNGAGLAYQNGMVEFKDEVAFVLVTGLTMEGDDKELVDELFLKLEEGRGLEKGDDEKALLGHHYLEEKKLFKRGLALGDTISVNGREFSVIGFNTRVGNSGDDQAVYLTEEAYEQVFGVRPSEEGYQMIVAKVTRGEDPAAVAERVKKALRRHRGLDEGEEDFTLQTTEEMMESFSAILLIVQAVIAGIAAISLLVGGVGIMNTMYTAVIERTKEIGIMKAIGARNNDILTIFLIESGLLGTVGGAIGVILGLGIAKLVESVGAVMIGSPYLRAWWSWELVIGALAFSFLAGAVSGAAPAYRASKQQPVASLRYE